ncbi:MAG: transporter substrate-binding protein [Polaromonas sp.]|jgi:tripartite-type tricarboxylate transporter receptor subunit TctC|nr:transporter substrate-binding protein [Polaromonas sp.]MDB5939507.1 transporter substrate-binding protein [Polaromonas sp.]
MNNPIFPAMHRRTVLAAGLAALASGTTLASAAYPSRPIRLIVGFSAGGGIDALARLVGPRLSSVLGQPIVVENRAGASGVIAGDAVAKAAPDGYTLLLGDSTLLIAQYLQPRMTFDPIKSFAPVGAICTAPLVVVTSKDFPASTPAEFLAALQAAPGKYSYATSGIGQVQHLAFELLMARSRTTVVHVPYRGASQILPDVISGQVPIAVVSAAAAIAQLKSGRLKAIAVMSPMKLTGAEDIPSLASVLPDFDTAPRIYIAAPSGTPQPIVAQLSEALRSVMEAPDMAQLAAKQGFVPAFLPASQIAPDLQRESALWGKIIRDQKITAE